MCPSTSSPSLRWPSVFQARSKGEKIGGRKGKTIVGGPADRQSPFRLLSPSPSLALFPVIFALATGCESNRVLFAVGYIRHSPALHLTVSSATARARAELAWAWPL